MTRAIDEGGSASAAIAERETEAPAPGAESLIAPTAAVVIESRKRTRVGYRAVAASHTVVDLYPPIVLALTADLQQRLGLTAEQVAIIFSTNAIVSGISQPFFAHLSDRLNTRIVAPIGLAVAAVCLTLIGFAQSFEQLIALQVVGMAGSGVYHPIAAGLAGELGRDVFHDHRTRRSARAFALSIFFACGMLGGFLGPIAATRINEHSSAHMQGISGMMIPGLFAAAALFFFTRGVSHRAPGDHRALRAAAGAETHADSALSARWKAVFVLFVANSLLFITNIGLFYLYKRWCDAHITAGPRVVSSRVGDLIAVSQLGMAVGGLSLGYIIRAGRERTALAVIVGLTVPVLVAMPRLGFEGMLAGAFVAGLGYFSVIPAFIAMAQRLLPHATGLVGSLLMGCGWAVSAVAPFLGLKMVEAWGIPGAFAGFAGTMILASVVTLALPKRLILESARRV